MSFVFDERRSDSPFVELIWQTRSVGGGTLMSAAASNLELVVTRQQNAIHCTLRGPETKASPAPIPEDAEFLGIIFKLGTFLPHVPTPQLVDGGVHLPLGAGHSFWLHGSTWQFPTFENADTFVERLVRYGMLAREPVVVAALEGQLSDLSQRSVQRRFRRATGLTHTTLFQIERARLALRLLQDGVSILDTVEQAGYSDQPHLTRALKHLMGRTPAQVMNNRSDEQMSLLFNT